MALAETGPVRSERPVYADLLPALQRRPPGRREHPGLAALGHEGRSHRQRTGLAVAGRRQSTFPADPTAGSATTSDARALCNSGQELTTDSVSIHSVERFLGEPLAAEARVELRTTREELGESGVLVVGSEAGAGLAAAYHLARLGHESRDP